MSRPMWRIRLTPSGATMPCYSEFVAYRTVEGYARAAYLDLLRIDTLSVEVDNGSGWVPHESFTHEQLAQRFEPNNERMRGTRAAVLRAYRADRTAGVA